MGESPTFFLSASIYCRINKKSSSPIKTPSWASARAVATRALRACVHSGGQAPLLREAHIDLMGDQLAGFAAAITAPLAMVTGFTIWGNLWTGHPYMLNCFKGCVATLLFLATFVIACIVSVLAGWNVTFDRFTGPVIGWLLLSSLLGIVVGDTCWLQAQQLLDTRSVVLIDSLKPALSAFWGFLFLGEAPTWGWSGAALSCVAVTWVSLEPAAKEPAAKEEPGATEMAGSFAANSERQPAPRNCDELALNGSADSSTQRPGSSEAFRTTLSGYSQRVTGCVCALLNVLLDSLASLITKQHGGALRPWDIAGIRFGGASVFLLLSVGAASFFAYLRPDVVARAGGTPIARAGGTPQRFYQFPVTLGRRAIGLIVLAISLTTFLASMLNNFALFKIDLFFVSTLGSLAPIWALVFGKCRGERATLRSWLGSVLAVAGVVVLIGLS